MSGELILAVIVLATAVMNYLRTRKVDRRVDHEFTNNGGTSARDLLDRIAERVIAIDEKVDKHLDNHP